MNEMVSMFDRKFSGKDAIECPNEGSRVTLPQSQKTLTQHGKLTVHGSGAFLICGLCGETQPIGRI